MALKVYTQWELLLRIDLELNVSVECFSRIPIIHFVKLITLFTMINWKILKKYVIFCVWFSGKLDIGIITLNYFVMPQRAQQLVRRRKWNMSSFYVVTTVKNTVSSRNFLVWKFCGKAQLLHSFGQFARIMWNYGLFSSARSHISYRSLVQTYSNRIFYQIWSLTYLTGNTGTRKAASYLFTF